MYAIIESGGKQFRVEENQMVRLDKVPLERGSAWETDKVLLVGGDEAKIGAPYVEGAKVSGTVIAQERTRKVRVFKYKPKKNYKRTRGHRQQYTQVRIDSIQA